MYYKLVYSGQMKHRQNLLAIFVLCMFGEGTIVCIIPRTSYPLQSTRDASLVMVLGYYVIEWYVNEVMYSQNNSGMLRMA